MLQDTERSQTQKRKIYWLLLKLCTYVVESEKPSRCNGLQMRCKVGT